MKILGPFVNTVTANERYCVHSSENLPQLIQQKPFPEVFVPLLKSRQNCEQFTKKMALIPYVFRKLRSAKDVVR